MTAGKKLAIGGTIVAAATVYMACVGLSDSWKYFLTVDECLHGTSCVYWPASSCQWQGGSQNIGRCR